MGLNGLISVLRNGLRVPSTSLSTHLAPSPALASAAPSPSVTIGAVERNLDITRGKLLDKGTSAL